MACVGSTNIYLAIKDSEERSHIEDQLVLDGVNVSTFASAHTLWEQFQLRSVRFVISDRRFDNDFGGIDLLWNIRQQYPMPYVYFILRSRMGQMDEIEAGLKQGVDDYLIYPHNPFQIRSRVMVGLRWLTYIDSLTAGKQ